MRERLIKFGRRLGVSVVGAAGVFWLLGWLINVPIQWPDHGRAALALDMSADVLTDLDCLIGDIEADPGKYRAADDFRVTIDGTGQVMVESRFQTTLLVSRKPGAVTLRPELRRIVTEPTTCGLTELLGPKISE